MKIKWNMKTLFIFLFIIFCICSVYIGCKVFFIPKNIEKPQFSFEETNKAIEQIQNTVKTLDEKIEEITQKTKEKEVVLHEKIIKKVYVLPPSDIIQLLNDELTEFRRIQNSR